MKNILLFDTETTGLPADFNAPYTDIENWPRLVQLAAILYTENGNVIEFSEIIRPDGFEIPAAASQIHGISTQRALKEGVPIEKVIRDFEMILEKADMVVCHNYWFDFPVIAAEMLRIGSTMRIKKLEYYCTKEESTDLCKIPNTSRYPGRWKWPSLDELYRFLFNEPIPGREEFHDAMTDVRATARCYFEMQKRLQRTEATIL